MNDTVHPATINVDSLTRQLLKRFNYWISKDKLNESEDLKLLGLYLYNVLLPIDSIPRQQLESDYDLVKRTTDGRLRLTLVFHKEAGELANYPWEFLYMPARERTVDKPRREGFFLAGQKTELILTRFVPNVTPEFGEREKELRILVIFSNPYDAELPEIDTKETREAIAIIQALASKPSVRVELIEMPTYEELDAAINNPPRPGENAFKPHIVHFIGHGDKVRGLALKMTKKEFDERKQGNLPYKETAWHDSKTISDLFSDDPPPRLVFLHACESARPDTLEGFSDLARELALAKIPAVVAMQYAIKTGDAALFAKVFYEELSNGRDVDEAVRGGREALGNPDYGGQGSWSDRRFGTPVVYLQSEKAIIEMPPLFDPEQKVACPNPDCDGKVALGWSQCAKCGHEVMICSECRNLGEFVLMDKRLGSCGKYGHQLVVESQAISSKPEVALRTERRADSEAAVRKAEVKQNEQQSGSTDNIG
jgi:hypothetical protein